MKLIGRLECIDFVRLVAWSVFLLTAGNVLAFVVHCANPVLMSDDWYFLDVFVRKAIEGDLHFADFFVKRIGPDHSEPFIKLVLLWCLRSFDLDISFEALIGVLVALGCVLLLRFLIFVEAKGRADWAHYVGWATICAIIFSLNGTEIWAWSLNSAQYSSFFLMPVFMWSVWRAYGKREYLQLAGVTLLLAFISDDNAVICVAATLAAMAFYALLGHVADKACLIRIFAVVLVITLIARIGYSYAPLVGGAKDMPLGAKMHALYEQIKAGQWSKWIATPMIWSIASRSFFPEGHHQRLFEIFEYGSLIAMVGFQCWFWLRAIRHEWNLLIFVSICLMLVTYGWIAGVLLYRIPEFGPDYFKQDRYVRLYQFDLVALVLMWVGTVSIRRGGGKEYQVRWGAIACLVFLALQVPMSVTAWASVPYRQRYDQNLARQIYALASNPSDPKVLENCDVQLPLCGLPLERRKSVLRMMQDNRLNIFSPGVLMDHPYLLNATSSLAPTERARLFSRFPAVESGKYGEGLYERVRSAFLRKSERWPRGSVDVSALPVNAVPLMLEGCWPPDGGKHPSSTWCGPEITLVLQEPAQASNLFVEGELPWQTYLKAGRASPVVITITVNGVPVARQARDSEGSFIINVPAQGLPASDSNSGLMYIKISADGSFVPSRFLPSQDARELSIRLSSVYFAPSTKNAQ
jgi:hypothetical protein